MHRLGRVFDPWKMHVYSMCIRMKENVCILLQLSDSQIDIQKSATFLYTNKKQPKKEIKKTILFTIASKIIKYFGVNLTKETKYLNTTKTAERN